MRNSTTIMTLVARTQKLFKQKNYSGDNSARLLSGGGGGRQIQPKNKKKKCWDVQGADVNEYIMMMMKKITMMMWMMKILMTMWMKKITMMKI